MIHCQEHSTDEHERAEQDQDDGNSEVLDVWIAWAVNPVGIGDVVRRKYPRDCCESDDAQDNAQDPQENPASNSTLDLVRDGGDALAGRGVENIQAIVADERLAMVRAKRGPAAYATVPVILYCRDIHVTRACIAATGDHETSDLVFAAPFDPWMRVQALKYIIDYRS